MDLAGLIDFLKHEDTRWDSRSHTEIDLPFDVSPEQYLRFAEEDLKGNETRNFINSYSNAKRALDSQVEALLIASGLFKKAKNQNWNIPKKIEAINELGIIAPRILVKMNKIRNLIEHEFVAPNKEQVEDFIDIVALFLVATNGYVYDFPSESEIVNETLEDFWLNVEFNNDKADIQVRIIYINDKSKEDLFITIDDPLFIPFLNSYLELFSLTKR